MRLLRIAVNGISEYERKAMTLDALLINGSCESSTLSISAGHPDHESVDLIGDGSWTIAHVYGKPDAAIPLLRRLRIPYLAPWPPIRRRLSWRPLPQPVASTSPLAGLPEAVALDYFRPAPALVERPAGQHFVGSCLPNRSNVGQLCRETMIRLSRFRQDVEWLLFDETPSAVDLEQVDVWVDPTTDPADFDGGTAEAMASGIVTISARTPIAQIRARNGSAGVLVPPNDPNELTHAILNVLFRPETTEVLRDAMRDAASGFDPALRGKRLLEIYQEIGR